MKLLFTTLAALLASNTVFATLHVSIEYPLSPLQLKMIQDKVIECRDRDEEFMKLPCYPRIFEKGEKTPIFIVCPPALPDKEGKGCSLSFMDNKVVPFPKSEFSMSVYKPIELFSIKSVTEKVEKGTTTPPEENHLNFGNPLNSSTDYINYYCQPEKLEQKKVWGCYLTVTDRHP